MLPRRYSHILVANSFVDAVQRARPSGAKGTFIKKVSISSTMGVGINVNI